MLALIKVFFADSSKRGEDELTVIYAGRGIGVDFRGCGAFVIPQ